MSVKRCQEEVDSSEFVEWCAFNSLNPGGEEREDLRNSLLRQTILASVATNKSSIPSLDELTIDFFNLDEPVKTKREMVMKKLNMWANTRGKIKK